MAGDARGGARFARGTGPPCRTAAQRLRRGGGMESVLALCRCAHPRGTRRTAMDLAALKSILSAVRHREPGRRIVIFGSSAFLLSLPGARPAVIGVETS